MTWQEALDNYYATHPTLNAENRQWIDDNVLVGIPLIESLPVEQILELFRQNDELNHTLLMRTLVWQFLGRVLAEETEPLKGNLRSFLYEHVDPTYTRNGLYKRVSKKQIEQLGLRLDLESLETEDSPTELLPEDRASKNYINGLYTDTFADFVANKIFRYQDPPFQIPDPYAAIKLIGSKTASIVFFTEKEGLFTKYCRDYYERFEISVMASRGYPTRVGFEYFADQLRAKKIKNVAVAGLVDYDPDGYLIYESYLKSFKRCGFGIKASTRLTSIDFFTAEALASESYPLEGKTVSQQTKIDNWFALTNGVNGEKCGMHINSASKARVSKKFEAWYKEQLERITRGELDG